MREIKFRYTIADKERKNFKSLIFTLEEIEYSGLDWIYKQFEENFGSPCNHCGCFHDFDDWEIIARDQYTGRKDINGKEIYDGDIIKGDDINNDVVVYKENKFILEPLGDDCIFWELSEVIGNIHENPELMGYIK